MNGFVKEFFYFALMFSKERLDFEIRNSYLYKKYAKSYILIFINLNTSSYGN
jgi:hypothetical protein